MNDLILALTILSNYANPNDSNPTHCEHDQLSVYAGIQLSDVSNEHLIQLDELGFIWSFKDDCFISCRFGSR